MMEPPRQGLPHVISPPISWRMVMQPYNFPAVNAMDNCGSVGVASAPLPQQVPSSFNGGPPHGPAAAARAPTTPPVPLGFHGTLSPQHFQDSLAEFREHLDRRFSSQDAQLLRIVQEMSGRLENCATSRDACPSRLSELPPSPPTSPELSLDGCFMTPPPAPQALAVVCTAPPAIELESDKDEPRDMDYEASLADKEECDSIRAIPTGASSRGVVEPWTSIQGITRRISHAVVPFPGFTPKDGASHSSTMQLDTEDALRQELARHLARRGHKAGSNKPNGRSVEHTGRVMNEVWVDGEPRLMRCWRSYAAFVKSVTFDYVMGMTIFCNTFFLGVQVDKKARSLSGVEDTEDDAFLLIETIFACIYFVELAMRMSVWRCRFCCSLWNIFDSVVVFCATIEECLKYGVGDDTILGKLKILRMMRVFKLMRTLRIIRVLRVFRELRIVMMSIICCLRSLVWTLVLMFIMIYIVAVLILVELTNSSDAFDDSAHAGKLQLKFFSNLSRSLLTLFQAITGGVLWADAAEALDEVIPWMDVLWVMYVGFCVFAITNTVTGIFVDQAMKSAQDDVRNVMQEEQERRAAAIAELRQMFYRADIDGTGRVTRKNMSKVCQHKKVLQIFKEFDIDPSDVLALFELVANVDLTINLEQIDAFTRGLFRLKGVAKNIDVVALTMRHKVMMRELRDRVL